MTVFAEIDAGGWAVIISAVGVIIANITALIIGYLKVVHIGKVSDATHTLVNSAMGAQLKVAAIAMRRVADLTRDPADTEAASVAEKALADHEAKQARVDRGETTPIAPQQPTKN